MTAPAAVAGWVPDSASAPSAPPSTPPRPPGSGTRVPPSWLAAQASISPCHGTGVPATPNEAASSAASPSTLRPLAARTPAPRRGPTRWPATPASPAASRDRHDRPGWLASRSARRAAVSNAAVPAAIAAAAGNSHQRPTPAVAAPATSMARITITEAKPQASTAHTPAVRSAPQRRYCPACQAAAVAGPAGSSAASPVEANTTAATARAGSRAPAAASSWRCAITRPASQATSAAAAAPSHGSRTPCACKPRASVHTAGTRSATTTAAPPATAHAHPRASRRHQATGRGVHVAAAGSWRAPRAPRSAYLMRMPSRTTLAPVPRAAPETRATLPFGRLQAGWSLIGCSLFCRVWLGPDHVGCWAADRWWPRPPSAPRSWFTARIFAGYAARLAGRALRHHMRPAFGRGRVRPGT
jgi:hypothetical protein